MASKNIVPRANEEGGIGTSIKKWLNGFFKYLSATQITLSGVSRTTWPDPGSGSQALTDVLDNGPEGNIPSGQKFKLKDNTGTDERFAVDEVTGGVGIGTGTPTSSISGSNRMLHISHSNLATIVLDNTSAVAPWEVAAKNNDNFVIKGGANEHIVIDSDGNVGIQETTPSKALDIKNGAAGGDILCYDIYTHDGGVETSDERLKEDILPTGLGLDFIDRLNPVGYRWKDVEAIEETKTVSRQKTEKKDIPIVSHEIVEIGGKYTLKEISETKTVDVPLFDEFPLYDETGNVIKELVSPEEEAKKDEAGDIIEPAKAAVYRDITHKVPVMEEITETKVLYEAETYSRTHQGLIAQQVGTVLDEMGLSSQDFAGFVYEEDRDRFGLRYMEFVAPLIRAVQELKAEIDILKGHK